MHYGIAFSIINGLMLNLAKIRAELHLKGCQGFVYTTELAAIADVMPHEFGHTNSRSEFSGSKPVGRPMSRITILTCRSSRALCE